MSAFGFAELRCDEGDAHVVAPHLASPAHRGRGPRKLWLSPGSDSLGWLVFHGRRQNRLGGWRRSRLGDGLEAWGL